MKTLQDRTEGVKSWIPTSRQKPSNLANSQPQTPPRDTAGLPPHRTVLGHSQSPAE